MRFPDWVENAIREEKRQEAAINQYYKIEKAEFDSWLKPQGDDNATWGTFADDEDEIATWNTAADDDEIAAWGRRYATDEDDTELYKLLEANEDIEV